ncbi:hypothetical protein BDV93DRAFT_512498 [Ceratobasidium sp. AG-I]|nr:hypothetical protein BDV93DRAFT_512498 [Ceratobasidium sp. AG-I]
MYGRDTGNCLARAGCSLLDWQKVDQRISYVQAQRLESTHEGDGLAPTGSVAWLSEAIELEVIQERMRRDVKSMGKSPTACQTADTTAQRQALAVRLDAHHQMSLGYLSEEFGGQFTPSAESSDGRPETVPLCLPSRLPSVVRREGSLQALVSSERKLRRVACLCALQNVQLLAVQEAHTNFKDSDLAGLSKQLINQRELGQGCVELPWYWQISLPEPDESKAVQLPRNHVGQEYNEALCVKWFRTRERHCCWNEEVHWLKHEMCSVILEFDTRSNIWKD